MPGISCVLGSTIDRNALQNAMNDLTGDGYSSASELYVDGKCAVIFSGHPGYPFQTAETESYFAVMEGMIYNRSQTDIDKRPNSPGGLLGHLLREIFNADFESKLRGVFLGG